MQGQTEELYRMEGVDHHRRDPYSCHPHGGVNYASAERRGHVGQEQLHPSMGPALLNFLLTASAFQREGTGSNTIIKIK